MAEKRFGSLLKHPISSLSLRAIGYGLCLYAAAVTGSVILGIALAAYSIYAYQRLKGASGEGSFMLAVLILLAPAVAYQGEGLALIAALVAGVMYVVHGSVRQHLFANTPGIFAGYFYLLSFCIYGAWIAVALPQHILGSLLALYIIQFYMLKEYLSYMTGEWNRRLRTYTWVLSLLMIQIVWACGLLSYGFLYEGSMALVALAVGADMVVYFFKGGLSREVVIKNAIIFALFIGLIGLTANL